MLVSWWELVLVVFWRHLILVLMKVYVDWRFRVWLRVFIVRPFCPTAFRIVILLRVNVGEVEGRNIWCLFFFVACHLRICQIVVRFGVFIDESVFVVHVTLISGSWLVVLGLLREFINVVLQILMRLFLLWFLSLMMRSLDWKLFKFLSYFLMLLFLCFNLTFKFSFIFFSSLLFIVTLLLLSFIIIKTD